MTTNSDLLEQYLTLDTETVSDALEHCGLPPAQAGLPPMWGTPRIAGFALTVELEPISGDDAGGDIVTDAIARSGAGDIIVIANGGRTNASCWGGLMSIGGSARSLSGVVADGACRDVAVTRDVGLPIFARGSVPVTARGRLRQKSIGAPVSLGGVQVSQGDVVLADEGGVAVIPRERAAEVLQEARRVQARKKQIEGDLRAGVPLPEAMRNAAARAAH